MLLASTLTLRPAVLADCESIFNWRNAEETKKFSTQSSSIALDDHIVWFRKSLKNPDRQLLIGESAGVAVGVVRFDRNEHCAVISVYLVPGNYGQGIGVQLIELGMQWVQRNWVAVKSVEAIILSENTVSVSAFSEAGFEKKSYTYVRHIRN
jgi:RimJ/RimL family protein N-acetyltransferase